MNTIVLNAMFAGSYGVDNIDGEIINFYLDDNGRQNYFVSAYGYLPQGILKDTIDAILMVYKINGKTFEVIGKYVPEGAEYVAEKLKDSAKKNIRYIEGNKITYGKVSLSELQSGSIIAYLTYSGGIVYLSPSQKVILTGEETDKIKAEFPDAIVVHLENFNEQNWGSTNYRIYSTDGKSYFKNATRAEDSAHSYDSLQKVVNMDIWSCKNQRVKKEDCSLSLQDIDFLGLNYIIGGSNVELLSSNWLAHYISECAEDFADFLGIGKNQKFLSVKRESDRIDILVEYENDVVVIENKIRSGIERTEKSQETEETKTTKKEQKSYSCQLEKYYNVVEKSENFENKRKHYIVLCPDFKKRWIEKEIENIANKYPEDAPQRSALEKFVVKTYGDLKKVLDKATIMSKAKYYPEFMDFVDNLSCTCEHQTIKKLSERRLFHKILTSNADNDN